jgi:hypothetical protein
MSTTAVTSIERGILNRARQRLMSQPLLWKGGFTPEDIDEDVWSQCTCLGLAIEEAAYDWADTYASETHPYDYEEITSTVAKLQSVIAERLGLPPLDDNVRSNLLRIAAWNDRPETTLSDAIEALS